jgi:TRAP-type C4-dicarboxylate transport system substrate-binding protein
MMRRKAIFFIILLIVSMLAACGSPASQQGSGTEQKENGKGEGGTIELNYAFFAPANTFPAIQMEQWADELEKRTNGKVKVNTFPGGSLLTAENMYEGVANGIADIGLSSTTYEPGRFPLLAISDMPSGYENATVASQVVSQLIKEFPPESFNNYKIITSFATEPMFIQTQKPVSNLKELKGRQLRIAGAAAPMLEELGASPVGMSQAEVAEALQTGIVNGYVSSREVLQDMKYAEMVKYVTDYPLNLNTFVAVMNKSKWESLPEDVQKVIDELNSEMTLFAGEYLDKHVQESIQWSEKEHGLKTVSLSEGEKAKWDELLSKYQTHYVEKQEVEGLPAQKYKDRLYELIEEHSKQ